MVLSTALFDKPAFKNLIVNGLVKAEDGKKMSKSLKNYPDPQVFWMCWMCWMCRNAGCAGFVGVAMSITCVTSWVYVLCIYCWV
jgi:hypothetical protein